MIGTPCFVDMSQQLHHVDTVCLLSKLKSTCYIDVDLDLSELDVTQAEAKATYDSTVFNHGLILT